MLEYDTGSEHLPQLTGKLTAYGRLAQAMAGADHVCPLLLFCFPTPPPRTDCPPRAGGLL
jgi:hypothetical protein